MKPRLITLLLFIGLLVSLSANRSWACGDMDSNHVSRFHHEQGSSAHEDEMAQSHHHCAYNANCSAADLTNQPCSDEENGHCHCPCCVATCHVTVLFSAANPIVITVVCDASIQRQAFYFAAHLPEAVYLPIWQPPQWLA